MDFTTVFAQYKITRDALHSLSPEQQNALERAAQGGGWTMDAGGGLLSSPQTLQIPPAQGGASPPERQKVHFPWADRATLETAQHAAQAQLLVFDVYSVAPLGGEMRLVHSSHFFDMQGDPILAYQPVPFKLTQQVTQAERAEIGFSPQTRTSVLAYRVLVAGEEVRTLSARLVFLPRRNVVSKVKWLAVYDHALETQGGDVYHVCQPRAILDLESGGKRSLHASTLNSTQLSGPTLHALGALGTQAYGVVDGELPNPPLPASRRLLEDLLRPPVPAPPKAPKPVKAPKASKVVKAPTPAPAPAPTPAPAPEAAPPAPAPTPAPAPAAVPSSSVPGQAMTRMTTVSSAPPPALVQAVTPPTPPAGAPDEGPLSWATLSSKIAVDEDVLAQARAAIARQRPLLLTGAPGTGKTLLATLLAEALCGPNNYTLVTADARWTSSEVLGGLRVVAGDGLRYHFTPGVVTRAALRHRESMQATGRPHALIIDEFNRAHQDEAFGRLLTLLDQNYRQQMPLVSAQDGADGEVYLPDDFLLLATMNNADLGRLHEIGSALQRRFVSVEMAVPPGERAFLERKWSPQTLDTLYSFVGSGDPVADQEAGRLRGYVAVGTFFMEEVLSLADMGLGLDKALRNQLAPHLGNLGRAELSRLLERAQAAGLERVSKQLEAAARLAPF